MSRTSRARRGAAWAAVMGLLAFVGSATPASAEPPRHYGPFYDSYDFTWDCGGFEARVQGSLTFRETDYVDESGQVVRWTQFIRAPRDVLTNTVTGRSITVRGEFQQMYTPDPETGTVQVAVNGFRYLVNEAGEGVTIQEVGRIVYVDLDEVGVVSESGQHDLPDGSLVEAALCEAVR